MIELENIIHEKGIIELNNGNPYIDGSRGTRIARDMIAFASAPTKINRSWKKTYIRAIIIGMNKR